MYPLVLSWEGIWAGLSEEFLRKAGFNFPKEGQPRLGGEAGKASGNSEEWTSEIAAAAGRKGAAAESQVATTLDTVLGLLQLSGCYSYAQI